MSRWPSLHACSLIVALALIGCGSSSTPSNQSSPHCTGSGALQCGSHGTCVEQNGTAACTCETGYAGATCDTCASGYQDHDGDGTCLAACTATTCNAADHQVCRDTSGTATCGCAQGYTDDGSGTGRCAWSGILQDPGFDNTPPNAWSISNGTLVNSTAAFDALGSCTPGAQGSVSQGFALPDPSVSDPLALQISASGSCSGGDCPSVSRPTRFAIDVGGHRVYSPELNSTNTRYSFCAGEAAYAPGATLSILPADRDYCSSGSVAYTFADADFSPAVDCPPLGSLLDGDFSAGGLGWTLATYESDGQGYGRVEATGPFDGSPAAHLQAETTCATMIASSLISVPVSGGTAVHFDSQVTAGQSVTVALDGQMVGILRGTGARQSDSVCLPKGLNGWVHAFSLTDYVPATSCIPAQVDVYLDNVSLVSDPSCAGDLIDPDAEVSPTATFLPWILSAYDSGVSSFTAVATEVHSGTQAIKMSGAQQCSSASAWSALTFPQATVGRGPALKYWLNSNIDASSRAALQDSTGHLWQLLQATSGWQQQIVCLPPERAGMLNTFYFEFDVPGTCGTSIPEQHVLVDGFEATTDPSCPSN